jgi:hypothetical protein
MGVVPVLTVELSVHLRRRRMRPELLFAAGLGTVRRTLDEPISP